jgi:predicted acylesterase/phospholipase RssA
MARLTPNSICLTAIHNRQSSEAYLLRSYDHQYPRRQKFVTDYNAGAEKLRIWEVTRATSAAPFYFKSLIADIENERREYKDGGIRENNPSTAAWSEFMSLYACDGRECDGQRCNAAPALLLSIGTGRPSRDKDGFPENSPYPFGQLSLVRKFAEIFATVNHMLIKYTEGESKHAEMLREAQGMHSWYKRLNVDKGLDNMGLDSWEKGDDGTPGGKTLRRIEEVTNAYLKRGRDSDLKEYAAPRDMVDQAAQKLVRMRRERERLSREGTEFDRRRWEHFTGLHL